MTDRKKIASFINKEYDEAIKKHGAFHSDHEAYAVLKEEIEEASEELDYIDASKVLMWGKIRADEDITEYAERIYQNAISLIQEAVQVAAVALKIKYSIAVRSEEKNEGKGIPTSN